MIIEQMRCYFLYNVPIIEQLLPESADASLATPPELLDTLRAAYRLEPASVPAFFTEHYRSQHAPFLVTDPAGPAGSVIPVDRLRALPYFSDLALTHDLPVSWEFDLAPQGVGLITVCVAANERQSSTGAYHLAGLHLDPAFAIVDTAPIAHLWRHNPSARPAFVTLDQLAAAIHEHFFRDIAPFRRYRALRHEIQIPLISIVVSSDAPDQRTFVKRNQAALADLLFRPTCWEVGRCSQQYVDDIVRPERVWSVAEEAVAFLSYEGALLVRIRNFDPSHLDPVSGFYLASEASVLHTFRVAVSNYHFMRIVDDLLDGEMAGITARVHGYQQTMHQLFEPSPLSAKRDALLELDAFVVQIINLQFSLHNLLEETRNSDKLIDEESHMVLLDKVNAALQTPAWDDSIERKVEELRRLIAAIERMRETLVALGMNESLIDMNRHLVQTNEENLEMQGALEKLQLLFVALAVLQFLQIAADIWFDGFHSLTRWLDVVLPAGGGNPDVRAGAVAASVVMVVVTLLSIAVTTVLLNALKKHNRRAGQRQPGSG